jgi:hypothetical protein
MILIDDVFVSDDVVTEQFICDLDKCKGACCIEGDGGAPLTDEEAEILKSIYEKVKPYLIESGINAINEQGLYTQDGDKKVTPLVNGGACAYLMWDGLVSKCGIEKAYEDGVIDFKKPISCHLYPIRIDQIGEADALNYYFWDICSAACKLGKKHKVPVYQFLKEPIVRKYGALFYDKLDATAKHIAANTATTTSE